MYDGENLGTMMEGHVFTAEDDILNQIWAVVAIASFCVPIVSS